MRFTHIQHFIGRWALGSKINTVQSSKSSLKSFIFSGYNISTFISINININIAVTLQLYS